MQDYHQLWNPLLWRTPGNCLTWFLTVIFVVWSVSASCLYHVYMYTTRKQGSEFGDVHAGSVFCTGDCYDWWCHEALWQKDYWLNLQKSHRHWNKLSQNSRGLFEFAFIVVWLWYHLVCFWSAQSSKFLKLIQISTVITSFAAPVTNIFTYGIAVDQYCRSYINRTPKPRPQIPIELGLVLVKAKVVGHDICAFVYFHSIVFCLDFHRGEQYLRKRGRKWDENKGRGREPGAMESVPHWSWFSRSHADSGATAATNGWGHLFILY